MSNLLGKLHLGSRTQAALLAQQEGLHPPNRPRRRELIPSPRGSHPAPNAEPAFLARRRVALDRTSFA